MNRYVPYMRKGAKAAVAGAAALAANTAKRIVYSQANSYVSKRALAGNRVKKVAVDSAKVNSNANMPSYAKKGQRKVKAVSKGKPSLKSLAKQVKDLKASAEADQGVLTYRRRTTGRAVTTVNNVAYVDMNILTTAHYETVLAQLRYYDPSTPTTLVTADGASGTFMKDFYFKKNYCKLTVRNNYQVPCRLTVYSCAVKEDTSISPYTAFANGIADIGNPTITSPLVYPSDSPQFKDLYKLIATKKCVLQPGEEVFYTHQGKSFQYDPSLVDSHSTTNQYKYGGFGFIIRCEGILGHDSVADEQGTMLAGIDWQLDRTSVVNYSAGAYIEYLYVLDDSDTFTNGGLTSSKPVADNIAYSLS